MSLFYFFMLSSQHEREIAETVGANRTFSHIYSIDTIFPALRYDEDCNGFYPKSLS